MSKLNVNAILFNIAGVGILLTAVGYMGYTFLVTERVARCTARFPAGQQFAFDSDKGRPLSPIELQARAGLREWGVLQNANITTLDGQPNSAIMEVSLATTGDEDKADQNGVGFLWPLGDLAKAKAACLSYRVFLPEGFKFTEPGYLPGLFGAADTAELDEAKPAEGFAVRMGWAQKGDIGAEVRSPASAGYWAGSDRTARWPLGRWVGVEQEVALNTPGEDDGILRIWIDGALTVENTGMNLRAAERPTLTGVVSEIGYARIASEPAKIKISPFVIQWQ